MDTTNVKVDWVVNWMNPASITKWFLWWFLWVRRQHIQQKLITRVSRVCYFLFLFFFPYFNEYFHIHVWKLLQLYGYLIYGQVASNQAQPISEFGFVSRRINRKKQGRNWIGNTVLSSNPRGPKHLHQYNPFFFFSTISIISVTDMKHSLICSYFIGFVGVFFVQTVLHF